MMDAFTAGRMVQAGLVKALIVDHDYALLQLAALILRRGGFHATTCEDSFDGLRSLYRLRPDVVLISDRMPCLSGGDLCARIKSDPTVAGTPIILVSDGDPFHDLEHVQRTGADAVIVKPYLPADLMTLVMRVLCSPVPCTQQHLPAVTSMNSINF